MNKSFGLATFQKVLLPTLIKHLSNRIQTNRNLVQDDQSIKIIDSPTLDYLISL